MREHLPQARFLRIAAGVVPVHDARLTAELADQVEIGLGRVLASLARDVANRPTRRAVKQAEAIVETMRRERTLACEVSAAVAAVREPDEDEPTA